MSTSLEVFRKKAKQLLRWHHEGNYSVGGRVRGLSRFRELSDREILGLELTLAEAQEIVAREQGHESWAALRKSVEAGEVPNLPLPAEVATLEAAVPVLFVRDVTASAKFFESKLGFSIDFLHGEPPFYASVSRDGARLHLRFVHQDVFDREAVAYEGGLLSAFIVTTGVKALYAEFLARAVPLEGSLRKEAWGGSVCSVLDLDGNRIHFVEMTESASRASS